MFEFAVVSIRDNAKVGNGKDGREMTMNMGKYKILGVTKNSVPFRVRSFLVFKLS